MPQRLKDDERQLLGIAAQGDPIEIGFRRTRYLLRRWSILGWFDPTTSRLTKQGKAMAAKHGLPAEPAEPIESVATEETDTGPGRIFIPGRIFDEPHE